MAFCSSYYKITEGNLQHIHREKSKMKFFQRRPYKPKLAVERSRTYSDIFARRYSEFIPEYNTRLPKAAGFQTISKRQIEENVRRMSTPFPHQIKPENNGYRNARLEPIQVPVSRNGKDVKATRSTHSTLIKDISTKSSNNQEKCFVRNNELDTKPRTFRKLTPHEENIIGECLNQPTVSALIRNTLRCHSPLTLKNMGIGCRLCRQPISQRGFRSTYHRFFLPDAGGKFCFV